MPNYTVNIVGCGRLGRTIAKLLSQTKGFTIQGVVNASKESAFNATAFIGQGTAFNTIDTLPPADITFITTRDDDIQSICDKLAANNKLASGSLVIHCSGSRTSDILSSARTAKCNVVSVHPIKSFANPAESVSSFRGTYCAMEGDALALPLTKIMFESIGGNVFEINKNNKSIYHVGGVIANNYLVTLHYQAVECYKKAGVDEPTAKKIVSMLMNDAFTNLQSLPHEKALTGPIQRGDTKTISNHTSALEDHSTLSDIYSSLGRGTLPLTSHNSQKKEEFNEILSRNKNDERRPSLNKL